MAKEENTGAGSLRRAVERSSGSGSRAAAFLVLALVAAAGCAVLIMRYLDTYSGGPKVEFVPVVIATLDLPLGTTITAEALGVTPWPKENLPEGVFAKAEELLGRVIVAKVFKGEAITRSRIAVEGAGSGLAAVLPPGYLAVSVRVDDVVGVAGFVHPADSVDVIVTMQPKPNEDPVSKFILYNVKVLAVGKQIEREDGNKARRPISATVATLMVTPEQAERLALAAARGQLLLALRSSLDEEVIETKGIIPSIMLSGVRRPVSSTPSAAPVRETVEIMRGDSTEQRTFQDKKR